MQGILNSLKKFTKNKNTVTIIGVVLVIGILYFGYNAQIKKQTAPQTVFIAKETIQPRTLITDKLVSARKIPQAALGGDVVTRKDQIVGKFSNYNTIIPEGSMFYKQALVREEELPNISFSKVKEGDVLLDFKVNMETSYGNSMMPKDRIDIYMKAIDENGQIMYGKLLSNIEIIEVKDSRGNNVFENSTNTKTPAYFYFGLSPELYILLKKTQYLSGVELLPVPQGGEAIDVGAEVIVTSQKLMDYINANSAENDEDFGENEDDFDDGFDDEFNDEFNDDNE